MDGKNGLTMNGILKRLHVNIPFTMLRETHLGRFLEQGINPEIGFDAFSLDSFSEDVFKGVARSLRERKLAVTIHAPFVDLSPGSPDPQVRALTRGRFEQLLQAARHFHPMRIVCHAGYDWKRYDYLRERWIENSLNTWQWMAKEARTRGAALMLENVYERGPEELAVLLEPLRSEGVGLCLDTGHLAAFSETPLAGWVRALGSHLGQLHLHDNLGDWDDHLAMGQGNIDFAYLFRELKNLRQEPFPITLEPHREEDLALSLQYLENIWPWAP